MPDRDLDAARERFINSLGAMGAMGATLEGHGAFEDRWRAVGAEAQHTEDLAQLDAWMRELARDRDRVQALRDRQREAQGQMGPDALMVSQLLSRLLSLLDELGPSLRRRLAFLRDERAAWVLLIGMGVKQRSPPVKPDDKAKPADEAAKAAALERQKKPDKPDKQKSA